MSQPTRRHPRRALAAACLLLPTPAALATTYDLSFQTVNLATAPYTADDTLNLSSVTFTSSISNPTPLAPSLNLLSGVTTLNSSSNVTLAGPLSGSADFQKSGTGSLTLTAPSPSFTGPVTINSGGTLKLTDPTALGPASATTPIYFYGAKLDVSGALPSRPVSFDLGTTLVNDTPTPATVGPSLSISNADSVTFSGSGDITFASPLPTMSGYLYKTGTGTVTYSTPTYNYGVNVSAGTLRLGIESPFAGTYSAVIDDDASLDLNGFNSPGCRITLLGGSVVNNNTSTPSNLSTLPTGGTLIFGGTGEINLTTKVATLTKTGTGTLTLSTPNPNFAGTLTINDGIVRLGVSNALGNSSNSHFNLNGSTTTTGVIDLNGFPAPAGTYSASNGGAIYNNNTTTPSTIGSNVVFSNGIPFFGGDGDTTVTLPISRTIYKFGPGQGTLTLSPTSPVYGANANIYAGILRLGNANALLSGSVVSLYGTSAQFPYRATTLDFNGLTPPVGLTINLYNNGGLVNNNTSTPVTISSSVVVKIQDYYIPPISGLVFGGDGTLAIAPDSFPIPYTVTLNKVGGGLLTIPASFTPKGVALRGGTLQVEANNQLGRNGGTLSFLGGTLRVAPLYLPPQPSYTFTSPISLNPTPGNTLDTQRDSTFTGPLTGTGPLTKAGPAAATLNPDPSSRLALTVAAGTLRLSPSSGTTTTLTALSIAPGSSLDLTTPSLLLDYTDASPQDAVRQYLHDHQLTTPATNLTHRLAYLDTGTTLTLSLALLGDSNLDGLITPDDYALLDRAYARSTTNAHWSDGDFNYDGTITPDDYRLIDSTYAQTHPLTPAFLSQRESQFGPQYVSTLLASVPEPASLAPLLLLLPLARRRRT